MPAVHLKIYGGEPDYTSENTEFVNACNKRVMEMSDEEADELFEARKRSKQTVQGVDNSKTAKAVGAEQSAAQKVAEEPAYPTAKQIIAETVIAVSFNNSFSYTFPLGECLNGEDFVENILEILNTDTGENYDRENALAGVKYVWWSDDWIKFDIANEEYAQNSFEFLLERVKKYDGSDGNCMVSVKVKIDD